MKKFQSLIVMKSILMPILFSQALVSGCSSGGGGSGTKKTVAPIDQVNPETGNPPVGTVNDDSGFFVEVLGDDRLLFNIHKGLNTFEEPCKIVAGEIVDCYVEAEEATFYTRDFALHYHVPSTMCTYLETSPFYFINRKTKYIQGSLNVFLDKNGAIGASDTNLDGVIDSQLPCDIDEGVPVCCVGKYLQNNYKWDLALNSYAPVTTDKIDRKINACLGGPAMLTQPLTELGLPEPTVQNVKDKGISDEYKISPIIGHGILTVAWNVNYFNPSQHGNGPPTAFYHDIVGNSSQGYVGNPYYSFTCYDSAWENIAEVRIQLRDWNTKAAYGDRAANPTNHDEVGNESTPFGQKRKNDFDDWYDLESGSITYPHYEYK
jgi:hypothetical protein